MYNNQFGFNNQQPFYNGYAYGGRPVPKCTQPITPELAKMLNQQDNDLNIQISNYDKIKNWCTHKEPNTGRMSIVSNNDGTVTCRTCGATFHIIDNIEEKASEVAVAVDDIIQTIKLTYLDMPEDFLKEYSQMSTLAGLLPKLAKKATNNFNMYESYTGNLYQTNPSMNAFQAASNILSGFNVFGGQQPMWGPMNQPMGGMPQQPMWGQPMGGMPQQQPMWNQQQQPMGQQAPWGMNQQMGQQPNMWNQPTVPQIDQNGNVIPGNQTPPSVNTMGGMPVQPGFNPFVNQPTVPNMPQAGGVAPTPAPTGPAAPNEQQQTKTMTV